jgi:hypothetical protein
MIYPQHHTRKGRTRQRIPAASRYRRKETITRISSINQPVDQSFIQSIIPLPSRASYLALSPSAFCTSHMCMHWHAITCAECPPPPPPPAPIAPIPPPNPPTPFPVAPIFPVPVNRRTETLIFEITLRSFRNCRSHRCCFSWFSSSGSIWSSPRESLGAVSAAEEDDVEDAGAEEE